MVDHWSQASKIKKKRLKASENRSQLVLQGQLTFSKRSRIVVSGDVYHLRIITIITIQQRIS